MERDGSTGNVPGGIRPAARAGAFAALTLLAALAPPSARAAAPLAATLEAGDSPGEVRFRLVNTSARTLLVLPAGTPLEAELSADVFRVTRSAKDWPPLERVAYHGRRVKRVPPVPADFVPLAPGRSLSAVVALERYYGVPAADDYRVAFDGEIDIIDPAGTRIFSRAAAAHPVRSVRVRTAGPDLRLAPGSGETRARPAAFARCDAPRRAALTETTAAAERLVADTLVELDAHDGTALASAPRYTRWFGPWAPGRAARVRDVITALLDSLSGATLNYDCGCDDPTLYAYVYPARLHDVFVCPAFFRAPLLGTDSRAGTLVHELSHFTSVAGTSDHDYGQAAVTGLALRDPRRAIANADSYEYFVENTPPLPMTGGAPLLADAPPANDDPDAAFVALPVDVVLTGALGADGLARFATKGAGTVSVDSLGGDADLYVFDDVALDALVCASTTLERSGATESCRLVGEGRTAYVVVHAYTDTRYAIRASGANTTPTGTAPTPYPTIDTRPYLLAGVGTDADDGTADGGAEGGIGGGGAGGGGGAPGALLLLTLSALRASRAASARARQSDDTRGTLVAAASTPPARRTAGLPRTVRSETKRNWSRRSNG